MIFDLLDSDFSPVFSAPAGGDVHVTRHFSLTDETNSLKNEQISLEKSERQTRPENLTGETPDCRVGSSESWVRPNLTAWAPDCRVGSSEISLRTLRAREKPDCRVGRSESATPCNDDMVPPDCRVGSSESWD